MKHESSDPPLFYHHTHHTHHTQQTHKGRRGTGQHEREWDNTRCRTQSKDRASQHMPPAIQHGHRVNDKGGANTQTGDTNIRREASNTTALHSPCHPPSAMPPTIHNGPTHHPRRGGSGQRIPSHTNTTDTHTYPHATHLARYSARHDSSTRQHCNGMSRARATPLHRAGQQQHTPPPFHTPRRMDTIHSSTHLLSLIHVHTTNERS